MHIWQDRHFIRRAVMLLDLVSNAAAFVLAMWIRYLRRRIPWNVSLYSTTFFLSILIYLFFTLYRRVKHHEYSPDELDPIENLSHVIRERVLQYVVLVLLLFLGRAIDDISRIMLASAFLLDMLFSYICRMVLRFFLLRSRSLRVIEEHFIIIVQEGLETAAQSRLAEILPENADCTSVISISPEVDAEGLHRILSDGSVPDRTSVFLFLRDVESDISERAIQFYRGRGIPVYFGWFVQGEELPQSMVERSGEHAVIAFRPLRKEGTVFGVRLAPTDVESGTFEVLDRIQNGDSPILPLCGAPPSPAEWYEKSPQTDDTGDDVGDDAGEKEERLVGCAGSLSGQYICFSNVHTTVMAHDKAEYRDVLNGSAFTFADGNPIAKTLKRDGFLNSERVAGPDFMDAIFRATMDGRLGHYFYGSTPETIEKLQTELPKRYPGLRIAGAVSPPFRPETPEEDAASVEVINQSGAAFVWIGLGAPKQEKWMAAHRGQLRGVMLGVGAGFDFYAGTVKRAPKWIRKIGLEWLFRLFQDPKRLANRYVVTNVLFFWYQAEDFLKGKGGGDDT